MLPFQQLLTTESFELQPHCLVWCPPLPADTEGPPLIYFCSTEEPVLRSSFHVALFADYNRTGVNFENLRRLGDAQL